VEPVQEGQHDGLGLAHPRRGDEEEVLAPKHVREGGQLGLRRLGYAEPGQELLHLRREAVERGLRGAGHGMGWEAVAVF
jgi:hypothetical protein